MKKTAHSRGFPRTGVLALALALAPLSCGIEDYIYLYPVQGGNINVRLTENAAIRLPSADSSESLYFTNFAIYYRIYVSDELISSEINTTEQMRTINQTLYSDYNSIYPSTSSNSSSSTSVNTSVGSLFSSRRYYELELENVNIESVLDSGALGQNLDISFPNLINIKPALSIGGSEYPLWRSTGNNTFNPQPDRFFVNTSELNRTENANTTFNGDVVDKPGISGKRYAYVSMYITKIGRDTNTLATIYSSPTFIGILKLPDDS
jgi:hypothetical protein